MGMPTTPAYIMMVALLVPAAIKLGMHIGFSEKEITPAAHMFAFYFAILSAITPPVALAIFAAAGLAKANMWQSGFNAMRAAAPAYIVPFMFVYGPALLLIGEPVRVTIACVTSVIGVICLAGGLHGYFARRANIVERLLLFAAALSLIKPGWETDLLGAGIIGVVVAMQLVLMPRAAEATD